MATTWHISSHGAPRQGRLGEVDLERQILRLLEEVQSSVMRPDKDSHVER